MGPFLYQCVFGLIVGMIAKLLMPGKDPGGCIITALLGLAGSALFSWLSHTFLNGYAEHWHWIGAIIGALLLLIMYRMIFGKRE